MQLLGERVVAPEDASMRDLHQRSHLVQVRLDANHQEVRGIRKTLKNFSPTNENSSRASTKFGR